MMNCDFFKNKKLLCFLGGAVTATLGVRILKSPQTRNCCVKGLVQGMKLQKDAQAAFQNIKDEAADICYDARKETETAE